MNPVSFPCRKCGLSIATKPNGFCRLCKEYRKQSQQLNTALPTENSARLTRKYSSIHHKHSSAHPPDIPTNYDSAAPQASSSRHHQARNSNDGHNIPPVPPPRARPIAPTPDPTSRASQPVQARVPLPPPLRPAVTPAPHAPAPDNLKCSICTRSFAREGLLEHHVDAVHKKIHKFKCTESKCNYASAQKSNLTRHLIKIHNIDPRTNNPQPPPANQRESSASRDAPKSPNSRH
jgi:hypothetical protein